MIADSTVSVSTIHCRLLPRLARYDMIGCLVESRLSSSWRRTFPPCWGITWFNGTRPQREPMASLRGIKRHDGAGLLEAIPERFEQLAHGRKGIVIKQGSHSLPEHALAAQLRPHCLEQGATQLLGLVHEERQHHQHGKYDRKMLRAMPIIVLEVIALVFQRIEGLVFHFPPRSATPHKAIHVALVHTQVRHLTEVLDLAIAMFPVLDAIDSHVRSRAIERHVVDKAKPMHQPGGAVMPFIRGDATGVCGRLYLLEQIGMIPFFDAENVVTPVVVQGLDVGRSGTQGVFGDDKLEMGVILAQLGDEAFGSMAF